MSSDGSHWCACSAANRPAPPAPRIRTSVRKRRISISRASDLYVQRGKRGRAPIACRMIDRVVEAAAVAVHRYQQRSEIANPELPEAFGIEIVEVDVLDRL